MFRRVDTIQTIGIHNVSEKVFWKLSILGSILFQYLHYHSRSRIIAAGKEATLWLEGLERSIKKIVCS